MNAGDAAYQLKIMLRVGACLMMAALPAVFLPTSAMAAIHEWLGLGAFPDTPLVFYLSRSLSALYAWHGVLLYAFSRDVLAYRRLIVYLGASTALLGVLFLGIDLFAGLPVYWVWLEGPIVVAIGLALLVMERRVPRS